MMIQLSDDIFPHNQVYLRKKRKMSQIALARQTGMSVHYLRAIEKGRFSSQLRYSEYEAICRTLEVSMTEMGTVLLETKRNDP